MSDPTTPAPTRLHVTVDQVDEPLHGAIVQALRDAGVRQDQLTIRTGDEDDPAPRGLPAYIAAALAVATAALLLAWIWTGDARWGATAGVTIACSLIAFFVSFTGSPTAR
ncbi:hypothetical protein [Streptomonospora litoralis]|uniref:Uncharacterized protein n=1 Tax=Streptomonospora litoralis TaxID=2498135 RepID=A0A4P6PYX3_9ACTN|nr:hypothetical protein [Streptomonospora litoralis]QBI53448.1 hypothetical protein EKD16_08270 [Streptomonospora litoralis]